MVKLKLDKDVALRIKELIGSMHYDFLGFELNLEEYTLNDILVGAKELNPQGIHAITTLLTHYSTSNLISLTGKLVKFRDLPGGCAYEVAFDQRAIQPIAEAFGQNPKQLCKAVAPLGGKPLNYGDASAEIPSLKGIPLTYIVWGKGEYSAAASILYDQTASNYLPTEDLAVLGEFTTLRLIEARRL